MTETQALNILEQMPEPEFQAFFKKLPERTKLILKGGLANWKEVLPGWYLKFNS